MNEMNEMNERYKKYNYMQDNYETTTAARKGSPPLATGPPIRVHSASPINVVYNILYFKMCTLYFVLLYFVLCTLSASFVQNLPPPATSTAAVTGTDTGICIDTGTGTGYRYR